MTPMKRAEEFRTVQGESTQVLAELRKALFSLMPSPQEGDFLRSPSPSGGAFRTRPAVGQGFGWERAQQFVLYRMGLAPMTLGAAMVTDRRNSTLRCYFRHGR
jgi:hypothetical protein